MPCEIAGEFDFLIIVNAESMEQYHVFTREVFSSNNNVRNFKSMFAMNCSKFETRVPLSPVAPG
ncbi:Lrp/AsnC ligand binding domain-containing protein [Variovorax sp. GT1P44]|uniref:Lrp/AsnC ligand binding domain-containing protein n=1 Tax=Variovorax sp. GT1P44 TaxID=3443742 RepID=UPI003F4888D6